MDGEEERDENGKKSQMGSILVICYTVKNRVVWFFLEHECVNLACDNIPLSITDVLFWKDGY